VSFTVTVPPTITSLSPTSGPVATAVTIAGTNFGATKGTSTLTFNGTAATPTTWSASSIVVPVPAGATTGNVVVTVGGLASNALTYTVTVPPTRSEEHTSELQSPTDVTCRRRHDRTTKGTSAVSFNGTATLPTLSPPSVPVATAVTIFGSNFGSTQGLRAFPTRRSSDLPTTWSASSIVVPVPAGATTGNVVVTVGGLASNALTYTVTVPPT